MVEDSLKNHCLFHYVITECYISRFFGNLIIVTSRGTLSNDLHITFRMRDTQNRLTFQHVDNAFTLNKHLNDMIQKLNPNIFREMRFYK